MKPTWFDRLLTAVALLFALLVTLGFGPSARAADKIRLAEQFGIAFLPLHVIRDQGLIEKHARAQGQEVSVEWTRFSSGASMNDALLSGSIDIGTAGIGPVLTIWDRTRGNADVKAIAALGSLPSFLVTRNPKIRSLKDFSSTDKIALPAAVVSVQARTLQIAAEKEFGAGKHTALDNLTVSLSHPDATAALLSGSTEITAHFSNPPFQYQALKSGTVHRVLSSYDVLGGPATSNIVYTTSKFRTENPKTYTAFLAALKEAVDWIAKNKSAAAQTYLRVENSKLDVSLIRSIIEDEDVRFTLVPQQTFLFAEFLSRTGALKGKAQSWKDYFFPDIHDLPGG